MIRIEEQEYFQNRMISNSEDTYLFMSANINDRVHWYKNDEISNDAKLLKVFPNEEDTKLINEYLELGNNLVVSLINPNKKMSLWIAKEENYLKQRNIELDIFEDIIELKMLPYNWLPNNLSQKISEAYKKSCESLSIKNCLSKPYLFVFDTGFDKGKLIISAQYNGSTIDESVIADSILVNQ
ncbi:hypothetical protein [Carnobacterium maltaromaticum]|uniref:hypothetical protein n=1 Tax=Carnobacterium maltaromaticum TaxID=2751 RepID=UPI00295F13ED|nr:hypothetical protein [Carnobacterium maltaromaticum]